MPKYAGLRTTTVVLSMSLVALFASTAHAGPIVLQTGFEFDTVGGKAQGSIVGTGGSDVGNGFTTSGSFPNIFNNVMCTIRGLSTQCLELFGDTDNPAITSVDTFAAGDYELTFDFASILGSGVLTVTLGNFTQVFTGIVPASKFTFAFTLASPAQLVFAENGTAVGVGMFDNIALTRTDVATPVPEPATLTLLAGPLLVGALRARRRTRA